MNILNKGEKIMWKYKNKLIRRVAVLFVLALFANSAFAQLTIKNPVVKDLSGATVNNTPIVIIYGNSIATPSPVASPYYSGTLYKTYTTNSSGIAVFTDQESALNTNIYMKAWKGTPGPNSYYGFYGPENTGSATILNRWDDKVITTNYKAVAPYGPKITKFEESTVTLTDGSSPSATLKVYSGQPTATDGLRELTKYAWKMWVKGTAKPATELAGQTTATLSLPSSQVSSGTTYVFQAMHGNPWGDAWGEEREYTVGGGVLGGGGSVTYALKKGINGVGLPVGGTVNVTVNSGTPVAADTLQKLVTAIGGVTAISVWDATGQKLGGATFDGAGSVTFQTPGFDLNSAPVAGSALYISVGADSSVTISK